MSKLGSNVDAAHGAELGSTSAATRNAGINTATGTIIYNSEAGVEEVQVYKGATYGWVPACHSLSGHTATGGTIEDYTDSGKKYRMHIFTSSGTFEVTEVGSFESSVDYMVVGGGGGGGSDPPGSNGTGGGGGAGGYRCSLPEGPGGPSPSPEAAHPVSVASYTVTIGGGGGSQGSGVDSAFDTIVCQGGGGGGRSPNRPGQPGGSGGGGGGQSGAIGLGNRDQGTTTVVPNQGYDGGGPGNGNGGGGADSQGVDAGGTLGPGQAGDGGDARRATIQGPAYTSFGYPGPAGDGYLAGGGKRSPGGGHTSGTTNGGAGPGPGGSASVNSGSGGSGGAQSGKSSGGAGGSGIVVIRYEIGPSQP